MDDFQRFLKDNGGDPVATIRKRPKRVQKKIDKRNGMLRFAGTSYERMHRATRALGTFMAHALNEAVARGEFVTIEILRRVDYYTCMKCEQQWDDLSLKYCPVCEELLDGAAKVFRSDPFRPAPHWECVNCGHCSGIMSRKSCPSCFTDRDDTNGKTNT